MDSIKYYINIKMTIKKVSSIAKLEDLGRIQLSKSFFMRDFLYSEIANWYGVPNLPDHPDITICTGKSLCEELLEPLQDKFGRIAIRPQYLVGKPAPDLRINLLGQNLSMPIITTPMGAHGLAHQSAELGTARGTGEAGTLMTVSTAANHTIEDIAAATKGPKWFQLYLADDLNKSRELLKRAEAAGYTAVVLAIDAFAPGSSDATMRIGFQFPPHLQLVNSGSSTFKKSLSWDDVKFVQNNTKLPLVLKGVLTPEMARKALAHGVAAIQVSNHGGRQLDGVSAAIDALPGVADVVKGKVPMIMDSGIRRGTDVFKALSLGANAVAIGRPVLYGLSLGGWMGVKSVYDRLQAELTRDMLIAGIGSVKEFRRDYVMRAPGIAAG